MNFSMKADYILYRMRAISQEKGNTEMQNLVDTPELWVWEKNCLIEHNFYRRYTFFLQNKARH